MRLTSLCVVNRQQFGEKRRTTEHGRPGVSETPRGTPRETPLGASVPTARVTGGPGRGRCAVRGKGAEKHGGSILQKGNVELTYSF